MSNRRGSKATRRSRGGHTSGDAVVVPMRAPAGPAPGATYRDPATRQRSEWRLDVADTQRLAAVAVEAQRNAGVVGALEPDITSWTRNVHDGRLDAYVGTVPSSGIHMSIAHKRYAGGQWVAGRYPTWDEIADARDRLLPADRAFTMGLPKPEDYVAVHATTFHLWEEQPAGVVRWADGTMWNVEIAQLPDGNLEVDGDGYPVGRLTPYAVQPAGEGEGDVTTPAGAPVDGSASPATD